MHVRAIQKARAALSRAQQNLSILKASNDFPSIEGHWEAFLDNANRVFTRLEQAAKATPKAGPWWGKQVHEWKTDPLLRYIRHARDCSHHTLQELARPNPGSATPISNPLPGEMEQVHEAAKRAGVPYTILGGFEVVPPHVECLDVINRGTTVPRPTSYLGSSISTTTPAGIGELTLEHMEKMIRHVESLG